MCIRDRVKAVDQCVIKVNDGKTDVSLNCYALKWPVGKTGSYKAKISSNVLGAKKITWTSSNTKIATIDANGKLKAVGPGAATVTCTVSAKSTGEKLASNTCKVEIYKPVSKVALNTYSIKWPVGRQGTCLLYTSKRPIRCARRLQNTKRRCIPTLTTLGFTLSRR